MISIRKATPADADIVFDILCRLEEKTLDRPAFVNGFAFNLAGTQNHYLLAEVGNNVVGFISCQGQFLLHHTNWVYEIQELYVDDAYRGHGVGKQLLQAIEEILNKESYDVIEVSSNVRRRRAHGFYLQNGFEQTHLKFVTKKV